MSGSATLSQPYSVFDHYAARLSELDAAVVRTVPPGGNWKALPEDFPSKRIQQIRRGFAEGKGSRSTYYGRLEWDSPAYTLNTYFNRPGNGCFIHPEYDRLITLREGARLQGFPDLYRFRGTLRSRYQQIGNAVPPLLAYYIAALHEPGPLVDVFCGAGGLSLGFEWAGFETLLALDKDDAALQTFSVNRSQRGVAQSIDLASQAGVDRAVEQIRERLGGSKLQIVVGGPPCQGFSTAGKCDLDDPRNQLVQAFVEVVERTRPRVVLMENVPALLWRRSAHVIHQLRERLSQSGYLSTVIVGHAEGYGVPQLRRRLFLLAAEMERDLRWPAPAFEVLNPAYRDLQPASVGAVRSAPNVADAIGDLPETTETRPDDRSTVLRAATSDHQRWARGEIGLNVLLPEPLPSVRPEQLVLADSK